MVISACASVRKVVPASETAEGVLCIELRIKMYHDGAMSKLLEKLSKVRKKLISKQSGEPAASLG